MYAPVYTFKKHGSDSMTSTADEGGKNACMHEQATIEFGVRIQGRKYLNECTLIFGASQCKEGL